jgi:hypothetical protein
MNHVQAVSRQVPEQTRKSMLLDDAVKASGVSIDALRKRLQRGLEEGYKGNDGKWRVYVNPDWTTTKPSPVSSSQVLDQLLEQVRKRVGDKDKTIDILTTQIDEKDAQLAEQSAVIRDLIQKIPTPKDEMADMRKKLDNQQAIVKRAYHVLQDQLKADVA